jgi:aryl-alcohol dehydrogenase-like predicted oxidoreductase
MSKKSELDKAELKLLLKEAQDAAGSHAQFVSVQNEYSLLHREPEKGVLPACDSLGLAFIPYFPLFSGLLTGKYRLGMPVPQGTRIQEGSDRLTQSNLDLVELLIGFSERHGHTLIELAFSYLLMRPEVSSVIAGATSEEQVRTNALSPNWSLTDDEMGELLEILGPR